MTQKDSALKSIVRDRKYLKGFTLIELLVVIAILTILLAIVLVAINPQRQVQQANNTQRRSDVSAILNAVSQYSADNNGVLPQGAGAVAITTTPTDVGTDGIDLCTVLTPDYVADLPVDPVIGDGIAAGQTCADSADYTTGYLISIVSGSGGGNRVVVSASEPELSQTISVSR